MKRMLLLVLALGGVILTPAPAEEGEESRHIAVLKSDAAAKEKELACRRLKIIGTVHAVPALAALLTDERLYQSACDVLETLPAHEAGEALRAALKCTTGRTRGGIIHALGERRHVAAIADLGEILREPDPALAGSAARALGNIGGRIAAGKLENAWQRAPESRQPALVDGLLHCAEHFATAGDRRAATRLFRKFTSSRQPEHVRTAAWAGLLRLEEEKELRAVLAGLQSRDAARQIVALQAARTVTDPKATTAFTNLLFKAKPAMQAALLGLLQQRRDPAAASAVTRLLQSTNAYVRLTAIAALGELGDVTAIRPLAQAALSRDESEQQAARQALIALRHGNIGAALVAELETADAEAQVELARALAGRFEKAAVPRLLELARSDSAKTRKAAIRALGQLVEAADIPGLVKLMPDVKTDDAREDVRGVFESLVDRADPGKKFDTAPIAAGLQSGLPETRMAMLPVASLFVSEELRGLLRAALKNSDEQFRKAATRALCNSRDPGLIPDVLAIARETADATTLALALEGYVRLVGDEQAGFDAKRKAQLLKSAWELAGRPEEKRLVLSALGRAPQLEALDVARRAVAIEAVRNEAEVSVSQIAKGLLDSEPTAALGALRQLETAGGSDSVRSNATVILKLNDSGWRYAGPYRQEGKGARKLFDIAFAPEKPEEPAPVWRIAPGTADLTRTNEADLGGVVGGNNAVIYLKSRVFAPAAQTALCKLGSDDGVKFWVNGELRFATNVSRGVKPGENSFEVPLRAGWNDLLAKVTQDSGGCGLIVQFTATNAAEIVGLRFDPQGDTETVATGFKTLKLSDQFYAEGAASGDINRDGKPDLVAGPFWFEGPDYTKQHAYRPAKDYDPHGYSDNFLTFTGDLNADGWTDIIVIPLPGEPGYWFENPGEKSEPWKKRQYYAMVGNESQGMEDMDGDGKPDLIFNNDGYLGYATYDPAKPDAEWTFHPISPKISRFQRFTHGIGAADVNGDGRKDMLEAAGWWEQPADAAAGREWTFHPHQFAEAAAQMLVTDVDGDGLPDVVCSWHCHLYGLLWWQQTRGTNGAIEWKRHEILAPKPDVRAEGARCSQLHAMALADINGDGLPDIVTGKRYWAHGPLGDVEPDAPAHLYWFELKRGAKGEATFIPHLIHADSGVGTQVTVADMNGDGRPDVFVANKKGIFLHLNAATNRD